MDHLLTYGLFQGELKHILEVGNGLSCNCVCANCKLALVAKNNPTNKKVAHFAHHSGIECTGAFETTLHLLAKLILKKTKQIFLPDYHFDYDSLNKESIFKVGKEVFFEHVILERQIEINNSKIIPDAIGEIDNKQIYIEFANTHFVDNDKKEKLKKSKIACVEIDLKDQPLDENVLIDFFTSDSPLKYWICNPRLDKEYTSHKEKEKVEEANLKNEISKKFISYKNNKQYRLLILKDGAIRNCPKKQKALEQLKKTNYYKHNVLKLIIDGQYWNGTFYGKIPNGRWIYLGKEKLIVYPPNLNRKELSPQQNYANKVLFAGLKKISEIIEDTKFGDCGNCEFSVDHFSLEDEGYEVCRHP